VRAFVRSPVYVKLRAITGTVFMLFGVAIIVRTALAIGLVSAALVPYVMGVALVGLGALRWRDYLRLRSGSA
jgi:hypothetical protein